MGEERVESQGFYEMLWDCEFCETKGLLAKSQRHCPECGGKQNADKRYFPQAGSEKKIEGHKYEGSDRYCPSCNAAIGSLAKNCTNCGAPQEGAQEVKGVVQPAPPPAPKSKWWIWLVVVAVAILAVVLLVKHCNRTEEKQVTIAAHRWERSIGIETFEKVERAAWDDDVPIKDRGNVERCTRKQKSSRQVQDGEECKDEKHDKKDGTFEVVRKCKPKYRSEPIDGNWCTYTTNAWRETDRVAVRGSGTNAQWPTERLPPETYSELLGAKRRGGKQQKYFLDMTGLGDKGQTCEVGEPVWKKYADAAKVKVDVRARTGEVVCDSL